MAQQTIEWKHFTENDPDHWILGNTIVRLKTDNGREVKVLVGVFLGRHPQHEGFLLKTGSYEVAEVKFDYVTGFDVVTVTELLDELARLKSLAESEP
jgi:hypothetical protein